MNMRHLSQESNSLPLDHHHNPLESFTNKVVRTDNIAVLISVATRTASTLTNMAAVPHINTASRWHDSRFS